MTTEYAVRYRWRNGNTHVGSPRSLDSCRTAMDLCVKYRKGNDPAAVEIVTREVGNWTAMEDE